MCHTRSEDGAGLRSHSWKLLDLNLLVDSGPSEWSFYVLAVLVRVPSGALFSLYSLKTCVLGESKLAGGVNGLSLCDGVASCPGCTSLFIKVSWDRLALCLLFGWTDLFALIVKWSVCTN